MDSCKKILYVISYRARNHYRIKNLKYVLEWLQPIKQFFNASESIQFKICIVEQDTKPNPNKPNIPGIQWLFLTNKGMFNKGWSFNCAVTSFPDYDYYLFADADMIIPDSQQFCQELIEHCTKNPKPAFRPFKDRLDTSLADLQACQKLADIITRFDNQNLRLVNHGGLSFAGNLIGVSKETYMKIGGWDEEFCGWGRYDDFFSHKLSTIAKCSIILSPLPALHLWHPITLDFSLRQENVGLYDKYTKYNEDQLIELINQNQLKNGNMGKYEQH